MTPLINLDLIYHYEREKALDIIFKNIIDKKNKNNFNKIIGFMIYEVIQPNDIESCRNTLMEIKNKCYELGVKDFYLVVAYSYKQYQQHLKDFNLIYFEAFSHIIYHSYRTKPERLSTRWNSESDKFLFLNAIPSRLNRIRLMSMYWKKGLLNNCIWSLFKPYSEIIERDCRLFADILTDDEYQEFIKIAFKKLDDVPSINFKIASLTSPTDWTIEQKFYNETKLSVVSETFFKRGQPLDDISEKTWRAIANCHPFIIAGTPGIRRCLESLGFKTFVEYLKYDYDDFHDYDERLNAIVENTEYFLINSNQYANQIKIDIEYNYQQYLQLIDRNMKTLEYLNKGLDVDQKDLDYVFNQPTHNHLIDLNDMKSLDEQQVERDKKIYSQLN